MKNGAKCKNIYSNLKLEWNFACSNPCSNQFTTLVPAWLSRKLMRFFWFCKWSDQWVPRDQKNSSFRKLSIEWTSAKDRIETRLRLLTFTLLCSYSQKNGKIQIDVRISAYICCLSIGQTKWMNLIASPQLKWYYTRKWCVMNKVGTAVWDEGQKKFSYCF